MRGRVCVCEGVGEGSFLYLHTMVNRQASN